MINFENVYQEVYVILLLLAFVFYSLSKVQTNVLVSIIIIFLLSYVLYMYLSRISEDKDNNILYVKNQIDKDIEGRAEVSNRNFLFNKFPKQLKYLKQNQELMDIGTNIRFVRKFSKSRYGDILLNMNSLMKIYIYILNRRYNTTEYIQSFSDIRDSIIEMMYSLIIIVPDRLKHTYGLDVYREIYTSIEKFTILSRDMMEILQKFAKIHNKDLYIVDQTYKPYNSIKDISFP
jgi:Ca2+/Na+ antiporter